MISRESAFVCLEKAAAELKSLSYEELAKLTERYSPDGNGPDIISQIDGETVHISTIIQEFGRFRKRVSVEMTLRVEGESDSSWCPFVYFERFASGRLYPPSRPRERRGLSKVLAYACIVGAVITLGSVVWRVFLR